MSVQQRNDATGLWPCRLCGGAASDRQGLEDHLSWCLGSGAENTRMLDDLIARAGRLGHAALMAEAGRRRPDSAGSRPSRRRRRRHALQ